MKKDQYANIRKAWKRAEAQEPKRWYFTKRFFWTPWFFCDYKSLNASWGKPPFKFHGEAVPESAWTVSVQWWPLDRAHVWVWKHLEKIIDIGGMFWKRQPNVLEKQQR